MRHSKLEQGSDAVFWGKGYILVFCTIFFPFFFGRISSPVWFTAGLANSCAGTTQGEGTNREMSCKGSEMIMFLKMELYLKLG